MHDLISFAEQHLFLFGVWFILLIAIVTTEILNRRQAPSQISSQKLVELLNAQSITAIDIRSPELFKKAHILNSRNIVWNHKDETAFKAFAQEHLVLICQQGQSAMQLATKLKKQGFENLQILKGGLNAWTEQNLPLVKGK